LNKEAVVSALKGEPKKTGSPEHVAKALNKKSEKYKVKDPLIKKLKKGILPTDEDLEIHTPEESWGFHLLIDCRDMNNKINSEEDIKGFFGELIDALDMKPLTEFFCKKVNDKEEGRGISAFQMITTSHIAMHFDDAGDNGFIDVFSCKKFDPRIVIKMVKEHFEPKQQMVQFVYRDTGMVIGDGDESDYEMHNTL
jgi:S-adenosylmethionine/arginine decarboxylase-like enzyme